MLVLVAIFKCSIADLCFRTTGGGREREREREGGTLRVRLLLNLSREDEPQWFKFWAVLDCRATVSVLAAL